MQEHVMKFDKKVPKSYFYHVSNEVKIIKIQFEVKSLAYITDGYDQDGTIPISAILFEQRKQVLKDVDIFYIAEEKFGVKDAFKNNRITADFISKSIIEDRERFYLVYEISVMKGYLVLSPKKDDSGQINAPHDFIALFQISVNDVVSISPNYRTSVAIQQGKSYFYSIFVTEGSIVDITVSLCRGADVFVTIYEGINKNRKVIMEQLALTTSTEQEKFISTANHVFTNIMSKKYLMIEVKYGGTGHENAYVGIKTSQTTYDDKVSLASYFDYSATAPGLKMFSFMFHPLNIIQTPEQVSFTIDRIFPLSEFKSKHPKVKMIAYDYTIMFTNERPPVFDLNNVCDIQVYHDRESFHLSSFSEKVMADTDFKRTADNKIT